jgi:hypothetical protein
MMLNARTVYRPDSGIHRSCWRSKMSADVAITEREVTVRFHRRAHLPIVQASDLFKKSTPVPWWDGLPLRFVE